MEHYSLKNLALQRFGQYISEIFVKLLMLSKEFPKCEFERKYLNQTCLSLCEYINENLLESLANELSDVTIRIISLVLKLQWKLKFENTCHHKWNEEIHNSLYGAESYDSYSEYVNESINLAVQVSCAAAHKSLTSFKYDEFSDLYFQQKYLQEMLLRRVSFREIIIDRMQITVPLPCLPMLECWSSVGIRNNITREIGVCDKLKILNLQWIEFHNLQITVFQNGIWNNWNDVCYFDFPVRFPNLIHLNLTGISITHRKAREFIFQNLSSSYGWHCSVPKTQLKSLALSMHKNDRFFISRYLPNITSLEIRLFEEIDLLPLKNLKHLTCLAITSRICVSVDFSIAKGLIQEIGSQLLVLNLCLSSVDSKFISTYCTQLKTFIYLFSTTDTFLIETADLARLLFNMTTEISTVENLVIRLCRGENVWNFFPNILRCFPNVKRLTVRSPQLEIQRNVSLQESLIQPLSSGVFREFIFNNKKIELCGERAFITSSCGYVMAVKVKDLENIMEQIYLWKEIPDMGMNYTIIPRQKDFFPVKMLQPV